MSTKKLRSLASKYKGMSFASIAAAIDKKYSDRGRDRYRKNAYNAEMMFLADANDEKRENRRRRGSTGKALEENWERNFKAYGGGLHKLINGGGDPFDPTTLVGKYPYTDPNDPFGMAIPKTAPGAVRPGDPSLFGPLIGPPAGVDPYAAATPGFNYEVGPMDPDAGSLPSLFASGVSAEDFAKHGVTGSEGQAREGFLKKAGKYLKEDVYAPSLIGNILDFGLSASQLIGGPDKAHPFYNPEEQKAMRLLESQSFDYTGAKNAAMASYSAGMRDLSNVRSSAMRNALAANLNKTLSQQLGQIEMRSSQSANEIKRSVASAASAFGTQKMQSNIQTAELNARNRGQYKTMVTQLATQLGRYGNTLTKLRGNERMQELYANILNMKYQDFGVPPDLYQKVLTNKGLTEDEIITLKSSAPQLYEFYDYMANKDKEDGK